MTHDGVLFLNELPEFNSGALEILRQPQEANRVEGIDDMPTRPQPARAVVVRLVRS